MPENEALELIFYDLKDVFTVCEKCPYSEFFQSVFPRIRTEYREIRSNSSNLVQMRGNTDQKNCEYRHFSRSVTFASLIFVFRWRILLSCNKQLCIFRQPWWQGRSSMLCEKKIWGLEAWCSYQMDNLPTSFASCFLRTCKKRL